MIRTIRLDFGIPSTACATSYAYTTCGTPLAFWDALACREFGCILKSSYCCEMQMKSDAIISEMHAVIINKNAVELCEKSTNRILLTNQLFAWWNIFWNIQRSFIKAFLREFFFLQNLMSPKYLEMNGEKKRNLCEYNLDFWVDEKWLKLVN